LSAIIECMSAEAVLPPGQDSDIKVDMSRRSEKGDNEQKYGQAGYPAVEKLIETEDFDAINLSFEEAYAQLHDISKKKRGFGTQRDIKRAMRSLELTLELFRELLALKYRLQEEMEKEQAKSK
jgi:hypothetical protein